MVFYNYNLSYKGKSRTEYFFQMFQFPQGMSNF